MIQLSRDPELVEFGRHQKHISSERHLLFYGYQQGSQRSEVKHDFPLPMKRIQLYLVQKQKHGRTTWFPLGQVAAGSGTRTT